MTISTLKELESVLKLCHKQGVRSITIDGISMQLGDLPELKTEQPLDATKPAVQYTDEDILMWSAAPQAL